MYALLRRVILCAPIGSVLPVAVMTRILVGVIALGLWLSGACAAAAQLAQADAGHDGQAPTGQPRQDLTPIVTAAIPLRAREAEAQVAEVRSSLVEQQLDRVQTGLPGLLEEMGRQEPAAQVLSSMSRRREQRDLLLAWEMFDERIAGWQKLLTQQTDLLARHTQTLLALERTWSATYKGVEGLRDAPPAALVWVSDVLTDVHRAQELLSQRGRRLFSLRERVDAAQQSVRLKLELVRHAEQQARGQLTRPEGLPLWAVLDGHELPALAVQTGHLRRAARAFWVSYGRRLPLDALVFVLFVAGAQLLARRTKRRVSPGQQPSRVFDAPLLSALLVALIVVRFAYPRAMFAIIDALGIVSLAVLALLVPILVRPLRLRRLSWALIVVLALYRVLGLLYLTDPWRDLAFLAVAALLLGVLSLYVRADREGQLSVPGKRLPQLTSLFLRAATLGLTLALLAGVCGYNGLLAFLLEGIVFSSHWLLFMIALMQILTAFLEATLASERIARLASMRDHGALLRQRALWAVNTLGVVLWSIIALTAFEVLDPLLDWLAHLLNGSLKVGTWSLSLGNVLGFFLTLYLAVMLARTVSFFLDEDILPRMNLARGVAPAVSRLNRYFILALGFILAIGAAGVDMSQVALLVSALSVGIGFGLQNVINNFVSGLVLIFERPVRVGDLVQVADMIGTVQSIGIRSSTLRTPEGAEAILPNSQLIAERVINWTLSDPKRRVDIQVGVAYGTDPTRVLTLLQGAVEGVPGVAKFPEPTCLFLRFGDSSLDFELRAWAQRSEDWVVVRSALAVALHDKLSEAGIQIPFPQRDLHLRSIEEGAARVLLQGPQGDAANQGTAPGVATS